MNSSASWCCRSLSLAALALFAVAATAHAGQTRVQQVNGPPGFDVAAARQAWEKKLGLYFEVAANQHAVVYSQNSQEEAREIVRALDTLIANLKKKCPELLAVPEKPFEIFFCSGNESYLTILKTCACDEPLNRKATGAWIAPHAACNRPLQQGMHNTNRAVYAYGQYLAICATGGQAQPWLLDGFASYCELDAMQCNENYCLSYMDKKLFVYAVKWPEELARLPGKNKLMAWADIFKLERDGIKVEQCLNMFGLAAYLFTTNPKAWLHMTQLMADGKQSSDAIEQAYGKKVNQMESLWNDWCVNQR